MCLICQHIDSKKLDPWEAARNRSEMIEQFDEEHLLILDKKIETALLEYLNNMGEENTLEELK